MHGTVAVGIVSGFVVLAVAAKLALAGAGPFESRLIAAVPRPDGSVALTISVSNQGSRASTASCRVTRGGAASAQDLVFATDAIPPGASRVYERRMGPPARGAPPYRLDRLTISCR